MQPSDDAKVEPSDESCVVRYPLMRARPGNREIEPGEHQRRADRRPIALPSSRLSPWRVSGRATAALCERPIG